ncbi:MAG: hypothetical protein ACXVLM_01965, partial [Ilumatobacteraceae bacterium]
MRLVAPLLGRETCVGGAGFAPKDAAWARTLHTQCRNRAQACRERFIFFGGAAVDTVDSWKVLRER